MNATQKTPYSYLMIDYRQETPNILRLRSYIFPEEEDGEAPVIFIPTDNKFI